MPVLDINEKDFRDPKVLWHEPSKRWVMAVAWPVKRQVRFYASPDLKSWTHLSDFGSARCGHKPTQANGRLPAALTVIRCRG